MSVGETFTKGTVREACLHQMRGAHPPQTAPPTSSHSIQGCFLARHGPQEGGEGGRSASLTRVGASRRMQTGFRWKPNEGSRYCGDAVLENASGCGSVGRVGEARADATAMMEAPKLHGGWSIGSKLGRGLGSPGELRQARRRRDEEGRGNGEKGGLQTIREMRCTRMQCATRHSHSACLSAECTQGQANMVGGSGGCCLCQQPGGCWGDNQLAVAFQ